MHNATVNSFHIRRILALKRKQSKRRAAHKLVRVSTLKYKEKSRPRSEHVAGGRSLEEKPWLRQELLGSQSSSSAPELPDIGQQ